VPAPLVIIGVGLFLGALGVAVYEHEKSGSSTRGTGSGLLPAFPRIASATPAQRRAILDAAAAIPVDPIALATVIQSESGWDTTAPHEATGTPRAGLNQITQGAHMPGLSTADQVWAVRSWPLERQLKDIVVPYLQRFKNNASWKGTKGTALDLYKVNFLPALAGVGMDVHLGEKDSQETIPGGLTKGQIYAANPGFDHGNKGYFTWADVAQTVRQVEQQAHGKLVDVAGKLQDWPQSAQTAPPAPAPKAPTPAPKPVAVGEPAPGGEGDDDSDEESDDVAGMPRAKRALAPIPSANPGPTPAPAIIALRDAVDAAWPNRGRWSDGILGDNKSRAQRTDHNQGNALDISHDPVSGPPLTALAELLWADPRVTVIIWNNKFRSRAVGSGEWHPYCEEGAVSCSPHTRHLHVSIDPSRRNDISSWNVGRAAGVVQPRPREPGDEPVPPSPHEFADTDPVGHYLLDAWRAGLVDNVTWIPVNIGPFTIEVAGEPLAVQGQRIAASMEDATAIARSMGAMLPTREIVDAIWAAAQRNLTTPAPAPATDWGALRARNEALGPTGSDLATGGWYDWILAGPMGVQGAVDYGLRDAAGGAAQPGRDHKPTYVDQLHMVQLVRRAALAGQQDIDLADWLSRGHAGEVTGGTGNELGGPIASSVLARFRS